MAVKFLRGTLTNSDGKLIIDNVRDSSFIAEDPYLSMMLYDSELETEWHKQGLKGKR